MKTAHDIFQCLVCSNSKFEITDTVWKCALCGKIYKVEKDIPLLVKSWEQLELKLEEARLVKPNWYSGEQPPEVVSPWKHHLKKRRLYVEKSIATYLQAKVQGLSDTLLDLGCGDGNNLEYLQKYAQSVYASDYNIVRLARARLRYASVKLFLADMLDYPVKDNSFDIIFFNHVLEHISEDSRALKTVQKILKPDGLLILGVPNEGVWWWQLAFKLQPESIKNTDHVHFYTAETICQKLINSGFKIIEVKHIGWGVPHWEIDGLLRQYKFFDDLLELIGGRLFHQQASSLYVLASK